MNLASLQKTIHAINVEKGWHEEPLRSPVTSLTSSNSWHYHTDRILAKLALAHSELSEALVEADNGRWATWYSPEKPAKPEGFAIEIADACIRVLDTCEALGVTLGTPTLGTRTSLVWLHYTLSTMVEAARVNEITNLGPEAELFIGCAQHLLEDCPSGPTLEEAIELKITYNRTRPYRHGGKQA